MNRIITGLYILLMVALQHTNGYAQEYAGHLLSNPALFNKQRPVLPAKKTTATAVDPLPLPFFEDFTAYGVYPDSSKWTDYSVYINNTMGYKPISRGVATFDALDWRGIPYDSFNNAHFRYADTLTSQPINMSTNVVVPGDSVYLSFFYQPQGNGFYPLPQDSLMLFFKTRFTSFSFVKVWSVPGSSLRPFQQVMIPISDSLYFDSFFQFRFINIGALYWADAVWNIDYIRLGANRNLYDTAINNVGFTSEPTFLLNDYTSMPYRQFHAYPAAERANLYTASLRNNYSIPQAIPYGYRAAELYSGTGLKPISWNALTIPPNTTTSLNFSAYTTLVPLTSNFGKVIFQNKYYIQNIITDDPPDNDTIVRNNVFDNYLAYDDGTAEKSYYLNLYPTLPGRIAIEHHINIPDTMRGMSIFFGRQIPFATFKPFDIKVYSELAGVNGSPTDVLLYTQEACTPGYADGINQFWTYKFDSPVPLPAGVFYAGTFQPAESGADSLYFGLDVNRIGSNHAYYNLFSSWSPSLISGAIMMRPLLGQDVIPTGVTNLTIKKREWGISPNPAKDVLRFDYNGDAGASYIITDIQGRKVLEGITSNGASVDVSGLSPAMYFVRLSNDGMQYNTLKFTKL